VIDPGAEGGRFAGHNRSVTLAEPGTYRFHCEVHPQAMRGVVTVTGAAAGGPAAASAAPASSTSASGTSASTPGTPRSRRAGR
jgi:Copper binding proteins, plastocyanin/azurin family